MKYSIYNSTINLNDRYCILYNAMSDRFMVLAEGAYQHFKSYSADTLEDINRTLYKQMLEIGAIVEGDIDEVEKTTKFIKERCEDETTFHLHINPTIDCNFRCWYCYEEHLKGTKMNARTMDSIKLFCKQVFEHHPQLRNFNLSFFGGEPLMYFDNIAKPIIEHVESLCKQNKILLLIHFTSNAYLLNNKLFDFLKGRNTSFQITLDGAQEFHDKVRCTKTGKGSYGTIIRNVKKLADIGSNVLLRINYTTENAESIKGIVGTLLDIPAESRHRIKVDIQCVWQDMQNTERREDTSESINEAVAAFRKNGFHISLHKVQNNAMYPCYGDKRNHVLINYNGDIYNCTARDFKSENRTGHLNEKGFIDWDIDINRRFLSKFSKTICNTCRIAPICGGSCIQKTIERENQPGCPHGYTEKDIDRRILDRFEYFFIKNY